MWQMVAGVSNAKPVCNQVSLLRPVDEELKRSSDLSSGAETKKVKSK